MALLKIDSGPITADLYLREVPRDQWHGLMLARRAFLHTNLPFDCRELLRFVKDAQEMFEPLGFASVEDMVQRGFELDPEHVAWAVEGLRRLKPNEPIPYQAAITLGKQGRSEDAQRDERGRYMPNHSKGDNVTFGRGNSTAYLAARLDRDGYPGLAAQVRNRTMSARAAARAAGLPVDTSPLVLLRRAWRHASEDERRIFREEIR